MAVIDWSKTASGNASVSGINFAERQPAATVNNSARELMAQVRDGVPFKIDTVAELTALTKSTLSDNDQFNVGGKTSVGDGSGGIVYWDSASTETVNNTSVWQSDEGGDGRFILLDKHNIPSTEVIRKENAAVPHSTVDMHYGILKGTGWLSSEGGGDLIYTVASGASAGGTTITLSSNASTVGAVALLEGQLITYLSSDGEYYTAVIASIASNVLTVAAPLEAAIAAGNNVFNFYTNESHPNPYGFKAIADYAIRQIKNHGEVVSTATLAVRGGSSASALTTNANENPGCSTISVLDVDAPTKVTDGVEADIKFDQTGPHELHITINTLGDDVVLVWDIGGFTKSLTVNTDSPRLFKLPVWPYNGTQTGTLYVYGADDTIKFYIVEEVKIVRITPLRMPLDGAKHVLLGDSWYTLTTDVLDRMQERLPNATFVNAGNGGDTAAQAMARFDAEVTPENPDYVWFLVGTNDYYGSASAALFSYSLGRFKSKCADIGAQGVIFTSSVGSGQESATRFRYSREYALTSTYIDKNINTDKAFYVMSVNYTVPTMTNAKLLDLGRFSPDDPLVVTEYYLTHECKIAESTSLGASSGDLKTLSTSFTETDVIATPSAVRFLQLKHDNQTGGDVTVRGFLKIAVSPDNL